MEKKRKVFFFTPSSCGGAERMTVFIAKMLPQDIFDVAFVIVGNDYGDIKKFIPSNYPVRLIRIKRILYGGTIRLWNFIRKEKPDVVFGSQIYLNVRLILAAKLCSTKVIIRNNIGFDHFVSRINPFLVRFTYKWADIIIAQQDEMRNEIISYTKSSPERVVTLHNPIDRELIDEKVNATSPYDIGDKSVKFVWTARVHHSKGQDILIRAFKIVHQSIPNSKLYIVGKYSQLDIYYQELLRIVKEEGLTGSIIFTGFDDNPYKWVANAECFVMPSRAEGLPNSLIEAMYVGKPVVATTCEPVVSRIVKDSYNGILVAPEDVVAMADAMQRAIHFKDFKMTYTPASKDDFISLFRSNSSLVL